MDGSEVCSFKTPVSAGQGTCEYYCNVDGGCKVRFIPSREGYSGNIQGYCYPPNFGGNCSGIPIYCTDCSFKCRGKAGSQFEEEV